MDRTRLMVVLFAVMGLLGLSAIGLINAAAAAGTGAVSGTVWGANGPAGGVLVSASKSFQSYAIATTDELGHYTLTGVAAGSYTIQFSPAAGSGLAGKTYKTPVLVQADKTVARIDGWLDAAGRIEGVATGPDGTYARDVDVCVYRYSSSYEPLPTTTTSSTSTSTTVATSTTSTASTTTTSALPTTTATSATSTTQSVTTTGGPTTTISGTVVPTTIVDPENDLSHCASTDGAGRYAIGDLRPGTYSVNFQPAYGSGFGYAYFDNDTRPQSYLPVPVRPGATVPGVNVIMQTNGSCHELSTDCSTISNGCSGLRLVGARTVEVTFFCGASAATWHASDGQDVTGNPAQITFASNGPFTIDGDITVDNFPGTTMGTTVTSATAISSGLVHVSFAFSFRANEPPPGLPGAPRTVKAWPGVEQALISWVKPADDGNLAATQYTVTAAPGGHTCTWTVGPRSCTITGLAAGTPHTFTVTATNAQGTGPSSAPSDPVTPLATRFLDVPKTHPLYDHVEWLAAEKITNGFPDGTYRGSQGVQRQAMAAFLYRLAGSPNGKAPTCAAAPFTDVGVGAPFCGEIAWLKSTGITTGAPDGTFRPMDSVSRGAMAAFLYRFQGSPNGTSPTCSVAPFTDVPVGGSFCGEITWLKGTGITTGYPDGTFKPTSSVSREAMAAFLHRLPR